VRKLLTLALAGAVFAVFIGGSVDFHYGDLRYVVDNWTMRHWDFVHAVEPACADIGVDSGGYPCGGGSTYTFLGPTTAAFATTTPNYTVQPVGSLTTPSVVTPHDATHACIFAPATVTISGGGAQNFTCEPLKSGTGNVTVTNSTGLSNPAAISLAVANSAVGYPSFASGWSASDVTVGTGVSDPFGGTAAISLTEDTSNSQHLTQESLFTDTANTQRTIWVMVKNGSGTRNINLALRANGSGAGFGCVFSTAGAVVLSYAFGGSTIASTGASSTGLAAGWTLISVTGTVGATTGVFISMNIDSGTSDSYTGDGASNILLYGPVRE
jgi:hypothetical protein